MTPLFHLAIWWAVASFVFVAARSVSRPLWSASTGARARLSRILRFPCALALLAGDAVFIVLTIGPSGVAWPLAPGWWKPSLPARAPAEMASTMRAVFSLQAEIALTLACLVGVLVLVLSLPGIWNSGAHRFLVRRWILRRATGKMPAPAPGANHPRGIAAARAEGCYPSPSTHILRATIPDAAIADAIESWQLITRIALTLLDEGGVRFYRGSLNPLQIQPAPEPSTPGPSPVTDGAKCPAKGGRRTAGWWARRAARSFWRECAPAIHLVLRGTLVVGSAAPPLLLIVVPLVRAGLRPPPAPPLWSFSLPGWDLFALVALPLLGVVAAAFAPLPRARPLVVTSPIIPPIAQAQPPRRTAWGLSLRPVAGGVEIHVDDDARLTPHAYAALVGVLLPIPSEPHRAPQMDVLGPTGVELKPSAAGWPPTRPRWSLYKDTQDGGALYAADIAAYRRACVAWSTRLGATVARDDFTAEAVGMALASERASHSEVMLIAALQGRGLPIDVGVPIPSGSANPNPIYRNYWPDVAVRDPATLLLIDVEADGPDHNAPERQAADAHRDTLFARRGWHVIRLHLQTLGNGEWVSLAGSCVETMRDDHVRAFAIAAYARPLVVGQGRDDAPVSRHTTSPPDENTVSRETDHRIGAEMAIVSFADARARLHPVDAPQVDGAASGGPAPDGIA